MDKLFVSDEIAIKLKEKGFIEPCMKGVKDGHRFTTCGFGLTNQGNTHDFTLPLHQQVIDWLRENYKLHIIIKPYHDVYEYSFYTTGKIDLSKAVVTDGFCDTYYEAINVSIKEALNLI